MLSRNGMIGPWAGLPVFWQEDMSFDEDVYRANVARTCKAGVPGVYTAGTTGEFYAMEFDEFQAVTKATIDECKKQATPCMIGITSTYTLGVQRRAAYALENGADAVQVALPFWMELDDREVLGFFRQVAQAADNVPLCIYETLRCKKSLTVEQHRAIKETIDCYVAVKANAGTVGCSPAGCGQLSEFVNVWVGEHEWSRLGPSGAVGCASALVYMNPPLILNMFDMLKNKNWDELAPWTEKLKDYYKAGLGSYFAKGFADTALDHLQGLAGGFLKGSPRSRGPYMSTTEEDVRQFSEWVRKNHPELIYAGDCDI